MKEVSHDDTRARFETLNGCTVLAVKADDPSLPPAFEAGRRCGKSRGRRDAAGTRRAAHEAHRPARLLRAGRRGRLHRPERDGDPHRSYAQARTRHQALAVERVGQTLRVDQPVSIYARAEPVEVGHVVFFTNCLDAQEKFYHELLGFETSDRYPGRGAFMRCAPHGGHHDLFLLALPNGKRGLNHVAFTVRDIHEVFGGGMHIDRCGWETQLGGPPPGVVRVLLVLPEPGRRADRVLRG